MELSLAAVAADVADAVAGLRVFEGRELGSLSDAEVVSLQGTVARLARVVEVPVAMVAGEVARRSSPEVGGGLARKQGFRNAVAMVAAGMGGTRGGARDLIAAGTLLNADGDGDGARSRGAVVADAFAAGEVSAAKAALVSEVLAQCSGEGRDGERAEVEQALVVKARKVSLEDLRHAGRQVLASWDADHTLEREQRVHEARFLHFKETVDGMVAVNGLLDPVCAAPLIAFLDARVRAGFAHKRDAGDTSRDPREAGWMRVDALADLARHGLRCTQPGTAASTTVVVRVSEEALRTGLGVGDCDSMATPLTAKQLRLMAVDAQILPMVCGGDSLPMDLGRAVRFFTPAQRLALIERDGGCAFCHAPAAWCDAHHVNEWDRDHGETNLRDGLMLCTRCHHRLHDDGWTVRTSATEVWFIPPASVDPTRTPIQGGKHALEIHPPQAQPQAA
ncbi:DUF222 domain-containing protein [Demequina sediminis]|uniref:DUF222 domain-containing protein n=2 Tax=Demequina sediminis TaxID=1930058 RepID=UPI0025735034|nr:DUF222 domain-containing protein [Demequina sediminis]